MCSSKVNKFKQKLEKRKEYSEELVLSIFEEMTKGFKLQAACAKHDVLVNNFLEWAATFDFPKDIVNLGRQKYSLYIEKLMIENGFSSVPKHILTNMFKDDYVEKTEDNFSHFENNQGIRISFDRGE